MRNFYWIILFLAGSWHSWGISKKENFDETGEASHRVLKRYALIVGSNRGGEGRIELRYAGRDAETFATVLRDLGGVDKQDMMTLQDPTLLKFQQAMASLRSKVKKREKGSTRTEVLVYYSGHADEQGLLLGRERYPYKKLRKELETLPVDVRIAIIDGCASGAMTREKGGRKRPAFLFDASAVTQGHAYLSSASEDEASQESDKIKSSFFTHYLVSGMRGGADNNLDGKVTLNEAYQFAFDKTLQRTEKTLSGPQHASYDIRLKGSGDLVLTDLRTSSAGLWLAPDITGTILVRDTLGNLLVELNKHSEKPLEIGLSPGLYQITLEKKNSVFTAKLELTRGKFKKLYQNKFKTVTPEAYATRGGVLFPETPYDTLAFSFNIMPSLKKSNGKLVFPRNVIVGASLNMVGGVYSKIKGAGMGIGFQIAGEDVEGLQASVGFNHNFGDLRGLQVSVGGNNTMGHVRGIQLAVGVNHAQNSLKGIQWSVAVNKAKGGRGLQQTMGANINTGKMEGAQVSVGANFSKKIDGIQIATFSNNLWGGKALQFATFGNAAKDLTGGQFAVFGNLSKNLRGAQLAVFGNWAYDMEGIQMAVFNNFAQEIRGAQISLFSNVAKKMTGLQLGLVNVAQEFNGIPLGIVNIYHNQKELHPGVSYDGNGFANFSFKSGTKNFYGLVNIGLEGRGLPKTDQKTTLGIGWGGRFYMGKFFLNGDASAHLISTLRNFPKHTNNSLYQNRLGLGWKAFKHLSVIGGASINFERVGDPSAPSISKNHSLSKPVGGTESFFYWPGFFLGVDF